MPGSRHDAAVFKTSSIYNNSVALPKAPVSLSGKQVPILLLGDPAYPLMPWLLKPFTGSSLSAEEESFNLYLSSVRVLVENAFGKFKARWQILAKKIEADVEMAPFLISTCCALHNLCERSNTPLTEAWPRAQPSGYGSGDRKKLGGACKTSHPRRAEDNATAVRNAVVRYLRDNLPLRQSYRIGVGW